jgi:hypothetical protein
MQAAVNQAAVFEVLLCTLSFGTLSMIAYPVVGVTRRSSRSSCAYISISSSDKVRSTEGAEADDGKEGLEGALGLQCCGTRADERREDGISN